MICQWEVIMHQVIILVSGSRNQLFGTWLEKSLCYFFSWSMAHLQLKYADPLKNSATFITNLPLQYTKLLQSYRLYSQILFQSGCKNVFHNFYFFIPVVYAFIKLRLWWSKYRSQSSSSLLLEICQLFIQVIFRFLASFEKYLKKASFEKYLKNTYEIKFHSTETVFITTLF